MKISTKEILHNGQNQPAFPTFHSDCKLRNFGEAAEKEAISAAGKSKLTALAGGVREQVRRRGVAKIELG